MKKTLIIITAIAGLGAIGFTIWYLLKNKKSKKDDNKGQNISAKQNAKDILAKDDNILENIINNPNLSKAEKDKIKAFIDTGKGDTKTQSGLSGVQTTQGVFVYKKDEDGGLVSGFYDKGIKGRG